MLETVARITKRQRIKNNIDSKIKTAIPDDFNRKNQLFVYLRMDTRFFNDDSFGDKDSIQSLFREPFDFNFPAVESIWNTIFSEKGFSSNGAELKYTLTGYEERILFLRFNYSRYQVNRIFKITQKTDDQLTEKQMEHALKWGDVMKQCRDQLIIANLGLVLSMGKRFGAIENYEMIAEGLSALLRAVDRFNVSKGFKFSTYACRSIIKAMNRERVKKISLNECNSDFELTPECSIGVMDLEKLDNISDLKYVLDNNLAGLTYQEKKVIEGRFFKDEKLHELGEALSVCKERIRQIETKALLKLKNAMAMH